MLTQQTLTRLKGLKLDGMARAFEEQLAQPASHGLTFEERFGLLVDRETAWRDARRAGTPAQTGAAQIRQRLPRRSRHARPARAR
jgi:hypothetical protein